MPCLFVSYRRDDSAGFAGRLTDALEQRLGAGSVFRDVDDITPGADFELVIERGLQQVQAVLVIIGPGWLGARLDGQRRLERADDYVRREIEAALASGKPVVPLLVGGATMPAAEALPASIRGLVSRHALVLGDASWSADVERLHGVLLPWLLRLPAPRARRLWLGASILAALMVLATLLGWFGSASGLQALRGAWQAEVNYPWNLRLQERLEFVVHDGVVEGTASFLGVPRMIEQVEWTDGRLRFVTRAETTSASANTREMLQHYELRPDGDSLRVRLQIHRSHSVDAPIDFIARRP